VVPFADVPLVVPLLVPPVFPKEPLAEPPGLPNEPFDGPLLPNELFVDPAPSTGEFAGPLVCGNEPVDGA